jgi:chemotaxis response regulator CheB
MAAPPSPAGNGSGVEGRRVEVVALVTSAGGLEALSSVLRVLPADFPAAVVVAQHLGGQGSKLVEILSRRIELPLEWARDGCRIARTGDHMSTAIAVRGSSRPQLRGASG